tara:strand:- start:169 stop:363 length:195 start_codon:yes stop_codon:yes gene_type:complete
LAGVAHTGPQNSKQLDKKVWFKSKNLPLIKKSMMHIKGKKYSTFSLWKAVSKAVFTPKNHKINI